MIFSARSLASSSAIVPVPFFFGIAVAALHGVGRMVGALPTMRASSLVVHPAWVSDVDPEVLEEAVVAPYLDRDPRTRAVERCDLTPSGGNAPEPFVKCELPRAGSPALSAAKCAGPEGRD